MKYSYLMPLLLAFMLSSCMGIFNKRIRGNGKIVTENRTEAAFTGVRVSGAIDLYVSQDSTTGIKVVTDENLTGYIITEMDGQELVIRQKNGINLRPTRSVKVYVSGPDLSVFNASGACNIYGEGRLISNRKMEVELSGASEVKMDLRAPEVRVSVSGAGTVNLSGETRDFSVEGSGSTDIKCFNLLAENTRVEISGAGSADVFASVKLDVEVSGAGDVKYKGDATVSQHVSGAGSVKKVN